jgi:iron-sulfur cluster repair protein YtfE (RIC family)
MKRHEALAPLSREHHTALILSRLLRKDAPEYKGLPKDLPGKADYAGNLFQTSLLQHFQQEETVLEKIHGANAEIDRLSYEIIYEHQQLRKMFSSIENDNNLAEMLDELGRALEVHIRKEERVLFPLIQQYCPEEMLDEIRLMLT